MVPVRDFYTFFIYFKVLLGDLSKKDKSFLKKDKKKIPLGHAPHPLRNPVFLAKMTRNLKFLPILALPQCIISNVIWKENAFPKNLVPISFC